MKEIIAYEMTCNKIPDEKINIDCTIFDKKYWNEYMEIYNECFFEMRKALEIEPVNFYSDFSQIKEKMKSTFLYMQNGTIIGAVSCYGNEIDDLIVNKSFQGKGIGKELLMWGMNYIKQQGYKEFILHVAEYNQRAINLYKNVGFLVQKIERVR